MSSFNNAPVPPYVPPYSILCEGMYILADSKNFPNRPVRLVRRVTAPRGESGYWWEVECFTSGYFYKTSERFLGTEINELEVLAWITR